MDLKKLKKALIVILISIIILLIRSKSREDNINLSNYILFTFNSFSIYKLTDIFSIVMYSLPITLWVIVSAFNLNNYYENYIFLVTRLGGQQVFYKKLFVKAFSESSLLVIGTYFISIIFFTITDCVAVGDISTIIVSLLLNYSVVIMLIIIFMIFRFYHYFSLALTFTYIIEVSLLVIGLFLKYMRIDIILRKNPVMNTIMFFRGDLIKTIYIDCRGNLICNLILIIILINIYKYFSWRRRICDD